MKKVTISADEKLIADARARACTEKTTLEDLLRYWLADYAAGEDQAAKAKATIEYLRGRVRTGGRKFTREEMNQR